MKKFLSKFEFGVLALLIAGVFAKAAKAGYPYNADSKLSVASDASYNYNAY